MKLLILVLVLSFIIMNTGFGEESRYQFYNSWPNIDERFAFINERVYFLGPSIGLLGMTSIYLVEMDGIKQLTTQERVRNFGAYNHGLFIVETQQNIIEEIMRSTTCRHLLKLFDPFSNQYQTIFDTGRNDDIDNRFIVKNNRIFVIDSIKKKHGVVVDYITNHISILDGGKKQFLFEQKRISSAWHSTFCIISELDHHYSNLMKQFSIPYMSSFKIFDFSNCSTFQTPYLQMCKHLNHLEAVLIDGVLYYLSDGGIRAYNSINNEDTLILSLNNHDNTRFSLSPETVVLYKKTDNGYQADFYLLKDGALTDTVYFINYPRDIFVTTDKAMYVYDSTVECIDLHSRSKVVFSFKSKYPGAVLCVDRE